jgi:hypothetical protein
MDPRTRHLQARATSARSSISLDENSQLALSWARRALSEHQRLMPAVSVVIRRALAVYADYLDRSLMDPADPWAELKWRGEARRVDECARGHRVDRAAWNRVADALESDQAIKPLRQLLRDPDAPPLSEAVRALGREPLPAPGKPPMRCRLPSRATEDPRPPQDHDDE